MREDLAPYRDELILSTKAGYDMWPGPYGEWGSRKYLLSSLDQSLDRMGLEYVDIFYSHRFDPDTPLEETIGALDTAVRQGKALYAGISSYSAERTEEAAEIARELGTPLLIHQPSYSLLNRWIEPEVLDTCGEEGVGIIAFSPLGQGMLTDRYLGGIPEDSRAAKDFYLKKDFINEENMARVRALNEIAQRRGQALAADGARLGPARPARDLGADRRVERRAARDQRRRAREPRVQRRGTGRDRQARRRRRDQHLGGVQRRVSFAHVPLCGRRGTSREMTASQAQAEARELSRLATDELSALPRGIGDIHGAISGRVFRALGPSAAPVRLIHDAVSRGVYEGVRGGAVAHRARRGQRRRARARATRRCRRRRAAPP